MSLSTFICRDDQEREWLLDMHRRLEPRVMRGAIALGAILSLGLPWMNPLALVAFGLGAAVFGIGVRLTGRQQRMEPLVVAWFLAQALFAAGIGIDGGEHTVGLMFMLAPMIGASGGFPSRLVAVCTGYIALLMIALGLGIHGSVVLHDPPLLLVPLATLVAVAILASAVRESSFDHQTAAVVDQLTGMLNRGALASRTHELAHQSALTGEHVGVIVLDVDNFKEINDRDGHQKGDQVLRELAQRLREDLRAFDLAYRVGGEEFVILMPGAASPEATALAEQLHRSVRTTPVAGVAVTVSVGVATSPEGSAFEFDEVFRAADTALYEAKNAGRDQVRTAAGPAPPGSHLAVAAA